MTGSDEHSEPQPNGNQNRAQRESKHPLEYAIFIFVVATAIATGFAACYTRQQWLTAVDTEKRQLRAYLSIDAFAVSCSDCGDAVWKPGANPTAIQNGIWKRIANEGQTPAHKVSSIMNWWPIPGENAVLPKSFTFPDHQRDVPALVSASSIGHDKHKDSIGEIPMTEIITFKNAIDKNITLFLYGHVDYCDIFNEPHSTAFCFIYIPFVGDNLPICDRYNGEVHPRSRCDDDG